MLDLVNSAFVALAACLAWLDVRTLSRSRSLRGVHMSTAGLFTVWPMWDLVYYSGLHQSWSMVSCSVLAAGRGYWLMLAVRYRDQ